MTITQTVQTSQVTTLAELIAAGALLAAGAATITLYSKPLCVQCDATVRKLDKLGLTYDKTDITEDDKARKFVKDDLGCVQAPALVVRDLDGKILAHFSGFRPDYIAVLA